MNQQALGATLALTDLALAADDHTLVVASDDRNLRRYHAANSQQLLEFEAHEKAVYGLAYNADGTRLATAGGDHTVGVWDTTSWELVTRCEGHTKQVQSVSFLPAGTALASAALDGTVRVWSLVANLPGERPAIKNLPQSEEASLVAASPLQPVRPREAGLIAERFATNNLTGEAEISLDEQIDFDWEDKRPEPFSVRWQGYITAPFTGEVTFTAVADDGLRLYIGGKAIIDGIAANGPREGKLMMTAGDRLPIQVQYFQTTEKAFLKLSWSWEGQEKQLIPAEAFEHQPIYVGDQIAQFTEGVVGGLMSVKYSHDGSTLVAGGTGKNWYLWTTADGKMVREGIGHNETIYSLAYNPAGNRLASVDYSGNVFYWDVASAAPLYHQQLPTWAAYSVVVATDGTELVIGTQDPRVMRATIPAPLR
jgi:WD40 repeat protein